MRSLIENPVYMTGDAIRQRFAGKWVLITNCESTPAQGLAGGIPVAVADTIFEGHRDGFYDEFHDIKYKPTLALNLNYDRLPMLTMFFGTEAEAGAADDIRI
jgi:hypothetical protein